MAKGQTDMEVMRDVRKVFARHWIDLSELTIQVGNGRVTLRGRLLKLKGAGGGDLTAKTLDTMTQEVRRKKGVTHVTYDVNNWTQTANGWVEVGRKTG